jgi:hypothetical protein
MKVAVPPSTTSLGNMTLVDPTAGADQKRLA